ncbi:MAG: hypothetical protein AABY22_05905 [Nanoarchaeota archaeon]
MKTVNIRDIRDHYNQVMKVSAYLKDLSYQLGVSIGIRPKHDFEDGYPVWVINKCEISNMMFSRSDFISDFFIGLDGLEDVKFTNDRKMAHKFYSGREVYQMMKLLEKVQDKYDVEQLKPEELWWDDNEKRYWYFEGDF